MIGNIVSKLQNHKRGVPLLRGNLHYFQFVYYSVLLKNVRDENVPPEIKYSVIIFMISMIFNIIGSLLLHNNQTYPYRSAYRRIDIASIFLIVAVKLFPLYVYYMKEDGVLAVLASIQWLMAFSGVFASLLFNYCCVSKEIRSAIFFFTSFPNVYLGYKMIVFKNYVALSCIILSYLLTLLGSMIYCYEWPNLVEGVFEFHELFHTICFLSCGSVIIANNSIIRSYGIRTSHS